MSAAIFEALERLYGVPRNTLATGVPNGFERPHPHRVCQFLLEYYSNDACRANGYQHYPHARIPAICPVTLVSHKLPMASSAPAHDGPVPVLPPSLVAAYAAPLLTASIWDADIYRLTAFDPGRSHATFAIDRFLPYRLTTGLMREEVHYALASGEAAVPLRAQLAPTAAALLDFQHRRTGGGVHTMCAFARPAPDGDFVIPLQLRSSRVGEAGGSYGVLPMAFHQPSASGPLDPREPATTALREIFEEMFGGLESQEEVTFLAHPAINWLRTHPADVHFLTTNLFISLLSGNYDFSLLLAVTNTDFWETFGPAVESGWESEQHFLFSSKGDAGLSEILARPNWEGQALGCCLDGLRQLRRIDPVRVAEEHHDRPTK